MLRLNYEIYLESKEELSKFKIKKIATKHERIYLAMFIAGMALTGAGYVLLCIGKNKIPSLIMTAVGLIVTILGIILDNNNLKNNREERWLNAKTSYKQRAKKLDEILKKHSIDTESTEAMENLIRTAEDYKKLLFKAHSPFVLHEPASSILSIITAMIVLFLTTLAQEGEISENMQEVLAIVVIIAAMLLIIGLSKTVIRFFDLRIENDYNEYIYALNELKTFREFLMSDDAENNTTVGSVV